MISVGIVAFALKQFAVYIQAVGDFISYAIVKVNSHQTVVYTNRHEPVSKENYVRRQTSSCLARRVVGNVPIDNHHR